MVTKESFFEISSNIKQSKLNMTCEVCNAPLKGGTRFCSSICHNLNHQKVQFSKEELEHLYFIQNKSLSDIGRLYGLTCSAIINRMIKFGIDYKSKLLPVKVIENTIVSKESIIKKVCDKNNNVITKKFSKLTDNDKDFILKETLSYPECSEYHRIKMFVLDYKTWPICELDGCNQFVSITKQATFRLDAGCCKEHSNKICAKRSAETQVKNGKPSKSIMIKDVFYSKFYEILTLGYNIKKIPIYNETGYYKEQFTLDLTCQGCGVDYKQVYNYSNMSQAKYPGYCNQCIIHFNIQKLLLKPNIDLIIERLTIRNMILINQENKDTFYQNDVISATCLGCNATLSYQRYRLDVEDGYVCKQCSPRQIVQQSQAEFDIKKYLIEELNIMHVIHSYWDWSNNAYEIDLYLPEYNIGIEHNGTYSHSTEFKKSDSHKKKMLLALSKEIYLIQIFEDEWTFKQDLVKKKLAHILRKLPTKKIGARQCELITNISAKDQRKFLDEFHIQGYKSTKECHGLYYHDELISLMSFTGNNLERSATHFNYHVMGGFNKLLQSFSYKKDIYTFLDLRWSKLDDNVYLRNGFNGISITDPGYTYVVKGKRESRIKYQKHKLPDLFDNVDMSKTESQIMKEHRIYAIYDAGHLKLTYEYRNDQ